MMRRLRLLRVQVASGVAPLSVRDLGGRSRRCVSAESLAVPPRHRCRSQPLPLRSPSARCEAVPGGHIIAAAPGGRQLSAALRRAGMMAALSSTYGAYLYRGPRGDLFGRRRLPPVPQPVGLRRSRHAVRTAQVRRDAAVSGLR